MPVVVKKRLPPPPAPGLVLSAGAQEDWHEPARALAEKLGWAGEPDLEGNDIRVEDAQNYLGKMMHEHFQAGAKKEEQPSSLLVCEHLALTDDADCRLVEAALKDAFETGNGATVTSHKMIAAGTGADLSVVGSEAAAKIAAVEGQA